MDLRNTLYEYADTKAKIYLFLFLQDKNDNFFEILNSLKNEKIICNCLNI